MALEKASVANTFNLESKMDGYREKGGARFIRKKNIYRG